MTHIPEALRQQVIARAEQRCEYCRLHQDDLLYSHEIDHIIPEKHRGETTLDNLCLACLDCNRFKGSDFGSFDPDTGNVELLFNPRTDTWNQHFKLDGAHIIPLTATGRVTVFILKVNLDWRVRMRASLMDAGRYPTS